MTGKWFMNTGEKVIEFNFYDSCISLQRLNLDFSKIRHNEKECDSLLSTFSKNEKYYTLLKRDKEYILNSFKILPPYHKAIFYWEPFVKNYLDTAQINRYIKSNKPITAGWALYSEAELDKLVLQKRMVDITVNDFIKFNDHCTRLIEQLNKKSEGKLEYHRI